MPRTIGHSNRSLYHDVYRYNSAYSDLRDTLLHLRIGACLPLANGFIIERYSAGEFNIRDQQRNLKGRGEVDAVLAHITSSDEIDKAPQKISRRMGPQEIREDDVALAKLLSRAD